MSLGRAANCTPRHAGVGVVGGDTPWRHAPTANGSLPKSPGLLCRAGRQGGGQGMHEPEALPGAGLTRKVLVTSLLGRHSLRLGLGTSLDTGLWGC